MAKEILFLPPCHTQSDGKLSQLGISQIYLITQFMSEPTFDAVLHFNSVSAQETARMIAAGSLVYDSDVLELEELGEVSIPQSVLKEHWDRVCVIGGFGPMTCIARQYLGAKKPFLNQFGQALNLRYPIDFWKNLSFFEDEASLGYLEQPRHPFVVNKALVASMFPDFEDREPLVPSPH